MAPDRYRERRPTHYEEEYWLSAAKAVVLAMLDEHFALTVSEIEARASDRTWNPSICSYPIDPHWFVNARRDLQNEGVIHTTSLPTRSHPDPITTWHRPRGRPLTRHIERASQRKRLLTARHNGWSQRGGAGIGLLGRAGEEALDSALRASIHMSGVTGSTGEVLGVDIRPLGKVDNSAFYVDTSIPAEPVPIQVIFEVKNTRQHYYADDVDVQLFLRKAAVVQRERPNQLILPIFVCRRRHYTLWLQGESVGFLPAHVYEQLVLPDNELTPEVLQEVRDGLGFSDLRLGSEPTNRHIGLLRTSVPKWARERAELWRENYQNFLGE